MAVAGSSRAGAASSRLTSLTTRDGLTISVNDYVYIAWPSHPDYHVPYAIARVMGFVPARPSWDDEDATRAAPADRYDIKINRFDRAGRPDLRLLTAMMTSEIVPLGTVRGLCEVRHRDLIDDLSDWKRREDHFFFHQLTEFFAKRRLEVVPTPKVQNAPPEVLTALRQGYSFVLTEAENVKDLSAPLRACKICKDWALGQESVRCDHCKEWFHMSCVHLTTKPGKYHGYACEPCNLAQEARVAKELGSAPPKGTPLLNASTSASRTSSSGSTESSQSMPVQQRLTAGRGRPRGSTNAARRTNRGDTSASITPLGSPMPEKTRDDIRGTRCTNGWPFRYFGQHSHPLDVLDPYDPPFPRATTKIGPRFQANVPTWEQQKQMGLGVALQPSPSDTVTHPDRTLAPAKPRPRGRPRKYTKRDDKGAPIPSATDHLAPPSAAPTPLGSPEMQPTLSSSPRPEAASAADIPSLDAPLAPVREFERGTDDSVDVLANLCDIDSGPNAQTRMDELNNYLRVCASHIRLPLYHLGFLVRAIQVYSGPGTAVKHVATFSHSTMEELCMSWWEDEETEKFDACLAGDRPFHLPEVKKAIPTKTYPELVRYYAVWKTQRCRHRNEEFRARHGLSRRTPDKGAQIPAADWDRVPGWRDLQRATSPAASVYDEDGIKAAPKKVCASCTATESPLWYKGEHGWENSLLCRSCGLYWRKYGDVPSATDLAASNSRKRILPPSAEAPQGLGVRPPPKKAKLSNSRSARSSRAVGAGDPSPAPGPAAPAAPTPETPPPPPQRKRRARNAQPSIEAQASATATPSADTPSPRPNGAPASVSAAAANKAPVNGERSASILPKPQPIKCVQCKRLEPKKKLQQCQQCSLSVHQGCYGLTDKEVAMERWLCPPCKNLQEREAILIPRCVLCPLPQSFTQSRQTPEPNGVNGAGRESGSGAGADAIAAAASPRRTRGSSTTGRRGRPSKEGSRGSSAMSSSVQAEAKPEPLTALDAYKPTECCNWAHLLCAVWMPDVVFESADTMTPVEGAGTLSPWRYTAQCEVCLEREPHASGGTEAVKAEPDGNFTGQDSTAVIAEAHQEATSASRAPTGPSTAQRGACLQCSHASCQRTFHVTCAHVTPGYQLSFGVEPVAPGEGNGTPTATFKGETGHWTALAYCPQHAETHGENNGKTYDLADIDPATERTALQTYVEAYKTVKSDVGPLLRRARRLDKAKAERETARSSSSSRRSLTTAVNGAGSEATTNVHGQAAPSDEPSTGASEAAAQPQLAERCVRCQVDVATYWYRVPVGTTVKVPKRKGLTSMQRQDPRPSLDDVEGAEDGQDVRTVNGDGGGSGGSGSVIVKTIVTVGGEVCCNLCKRKVFRNGQVPE